MANGLQLDIATPERVSMSLPVAGIGYRSLAYLIDAALIFAFWTLLYFLYALTGPDLVKLVGDMSTVMRVIGLVGIFLTLFAYWTFCEVLMHGQTPGKRMLRIRVVRGDGSPVGVFESAVRNLLRVVDFLPALYGIGIVVMLIDTRHRRIGDLAAGTLCIREEKIDLSKYAQPAAVPAAPAAVGRALTVQEHELVRSLRDRFDALEPEARLRLARTMALKLGDESPVDEAAARAWLERRSAA